MAGAYLPLGHRHRIGLFQRPYRSVVIDGVLSMERATKKAIRRFGIAGAVLLFGLIFVPLLTIFYIGCGLIDVMRNKRRDAMVFRQYFMGNGITTWLANWKKKGWKTAGRQPVKNVDLWQALDELNQRHQVEWHWVKGHSGHRENEIADQLANRGIDELVLSRVGA